jgi:hypothetical protein
MSTRREFITLLGGAAAAWPVAVLAQHARRVARIGYLDFGTPSFSASYISAFREGLRNLGYVEGENLQIEFRFAEGENNLLPGLAIELIRASMSSSLMQPEFRRAECDIDDPDCHGDLQRRGRRRDRCQRCKSGW